MGNPKKGMHYEDVRSRIKRMEKDAKAGNVKNPELKNRLKTSLLNQCRLHEGSGAVKEIEKELRMG